MLSKRTFILDMVVVSVTLFATVICYVADSYQLAILTALLAGVNSWKAASYWLYRPYVELEKARARCDLINQVIQITFPDTSFPGGAVAIASERLRHLLIGYAPEHDHQHNECELALCACLILEDYLSEVTGVAPDRGEAFEASKIGWPGHRADRVIQKYGKNYYARLSIAGSLIAAELDRLNQVQKDELYQENRE